MKVISNTLLPPVHPGEILRDRLLKPLNISTAKLAKELKVSEKEIKGICEKKSNITPDLAHRLSIYFDTSTELWLNLQKDYEEELEERKLEELKKKRQGMTETKKITLIICAFCKKTISNSTIKPLVCICEEDNFFHYECYEKSGEEVDDEPEKKLTHKEVIGRNNCPKPKKANCFQCRRRVIIKWNKPRRKHSEKNNLGYYTEKEEDKDKYFCEKCISELYYQNKTKYWQLVPNLKKRQVLKTYIYLNTLKIKKH